MLKMILAIDKNNLVGNTNSKNGLAWHYPEDLKYFKEQTVGKINIMGRKTFAAIGSALPNRKTIVLTKDETYHADGITTINNLDDIIKLSKDNEVIICGGVSLYQQFNQHVDEILITLIDNEHQGDIYYNNLDLKNFKLNSEVIGKDEVLKYQIWGRNEGSSIRRKN